MRLILRLAAAEHSQTVTGRWQRNTVRLSVAGGLDWIGLDWMDWIGLDWMAGGLDWIGLDWIGWPVAWIGLDWIGLDGVPPPTIDENSQILYRRLIEPPQPTRGRGLLAIPAPG